MARPNGRRDATLERNENSMARARDRQAECIEADRDLLAANRELDKAQDHVLSAERRICRLHQIDEQLCRRLHNENVAASRGAA